MMQTTCMHETNRYNYAIIHVMISGAKHVWIKVQEKILGSCRGGCAAESSLTWWCYLLRVIYARLKRWWITRALARLSFVCRVSVCCIEALLVGQPHLQKTKVRTEMRTHARAKNHDHIPACHVQRVHVFVCSPASSLPFNTEVCSHICTKEEGKLSRSPGRALKSLTSIHNFTY